MAQIIITGVIKEITSMESGISQSGKHWTKCEVAITEQNGQYPNEISLVAFNEAINMLNGYAVGSYVQVTGWALSRASDKNGKRYYNTQIRLNAIQPLNQNVAPQQQQYPASQPRPQSTPQHSQPSTQPPQGSYMPYGNSF